MHRHRQHKSRFKLYSINKSASVQVIATFLEQITKEIERNT
jgi:hypothetical protein